MSYAELIDDGTLTFFPAGRRRPMPEVNAPFMYVSADDGDAENWPNPIDMLEQKGREDQSRPRHLPTRPSREG